MKKKLLPNGYRRLTPTEKVKEGDYMTAASNLDFSRKSGEQMTIDANGWISADSYYVGKTEKQINPESILLTFITPIKPKSVESSHSSAEQSGTVSANVTPVE